MGWIAVAHNSAVTVGIFIHSTAIKQQANHVINTVVGDEESVIGFQMRKNTKKERGRGAVREVRWRGVFCGRFLMQCGPCRGCCGICI